MSYEKFKDNLKSMMMDDFPDHIDIIESQQFYETMDYLIEKAKKHGFENPIHWSIFILSAWVLGIDFDEEYSPIKKKFKDSNLTSQQKIEWLEIYTDILLNQNTS